MKLITPEEMVDLELSGWNPKPGDKVSGIVLDREDGVQGGFEPYTMLTVQTGDDTAVNVHCFHSVLRGMVQSKNPQVGDVIAIKYLGKQKSREGARYDSFEAYNVVVRKSERPAPAPRDTSPVHQAVAEQTGISSSTLREEAVPLPSDRDVPVEDDIIF